MSVLYPVPQPRPVVVAKPQVVQMRASVSELPPLTMVPLAPPGWGR